MIEAQSVQSDVYDVGGKIRQYRQAHRLSQEDLAEKSGFSRKTVSRAEVGDATFSLSGFFKVCDILGVTPNELSPERFNRNGGGEAEKADFLATFISLNEGNRQIITKMMKALALQEIMMQV